MAVEAGHVQITEFSKEVIPQINWMLEDLFCQYGVAMPYFLLDFDFPDYSERPDWVSGYSFNLDWGPWGYWLPWFNELMGLLFDEAHLPRWQMPDLSLGSWAFFNDYVSELYDNMQRHYIYDQSGTFTKDEVIEGETSEVTGFYKWKDSDGYLHICNKRDASGEHVRDFEEEKIVGQTSGAYAWTSEWTTQSSDSTTITPNHVQRWGYMCLSEGAPYCSAGYANYISNPQYKTFTQRLNECGGQFYGYAKRVAYNTLSTAASPYADECSDLGALAVLADRLFLKFDTTDARTGASTAKVTVYVKCMYTWGSMSGNPVLTLYKYDYGDEVDTNDWAGGELLQTQEITATGSYDLSISPDDVNIGGLTKLKLSLQQMDNAVDLGDCGGWGLEFTPTQTLTLTR